MSKSRHTEAQIITALKQVEAGRTAEDVAREQGVSKHTIYAWKAAAETRGNAQQVQERNREKFLSVFSRGLAVLGYERDVEGNGKFLLAHWDEKWSYAAEA